ncbi:MAG: ATP-binding protein [Minisyncoccia bacterium]
MDQNNEGIIFYELCNDKGVVVARNGQLDTLPEVFSNKPNENFSEKGLKSVYRKNMHGSIYVIFNKESELFQGNKAIQRACDIYLSLIPKFKQIELSQRQHFDVIIRRFSHNLIKFQKRFKDNFNRLISDKARARSYSDFKDEVKRRIEENTSIAADDICQMSHRAIDLDAQIETLRIIGGYADNTGSLLPTDIAKAMYRLSNPFVDELIKRNIEIIINIKDSEHNKVKVVHSLFNAAIWQLFDNVCKYTLSDTDVEITASLESEPKKLMISMVSISIDEDEKEAIFSEYKQGRNVKKGMKSEINKESSGIGLFIVRQALNYTKAKISVSNDGFVKEENGYPYSRHTFEIEFNG